MLNNVAPINLFWESLSTLLRPSIGPGHIIYPPYPESGVDLPASELIPLSEMISPALLTPSSSYSYSSFSYQPKVSSAGKYPWHITPSAWISTHGYGDRVKIDPSKHPHPNPWSLLMYLIWQRLFRYD